MELKQPFYGLNFFDLYETSKSSTAGDTVDSNYKKDDRLNATLWNSPFLVIKIREGCPYSDYEFPLR